MSNWEETATKEYWDAWDNGSRTAVEMLDAMLTTLDRILKQEKIALLKHLVSFSEDMDMPVDAYIRQLINEGEAK